MKKNNQIIILVIVVTVVIFSLIYFSQLKSQISGKTRDNQTEINTVKIASSSVSKSSSLLIPPNDKNFDFLSLDGKYFDESSDVYSSSKVSISSSTGEFLNFVIDTTNLGHGGYYSEKAYRIASSSLVYVADKQTQDNNSLCIITLVFVDNSHLKYYTEEPKNLIDGNGGCRDNLGAHGAFMDGSVHKKNGEYSFPTIEVLGFTKEDIKQFEGLIPDLITSAQMFLNKDGSNATKLISQNIKNATAYSFQTPNIYNAQECDFAYPSGSCVFVMFMKDENGHYWIMGGNTYDAMEKGVKRFGFKYGTNNPEWKDRLPDVFKLELDRLELRNG